MAPLSVALTLTNPTLRTGIEAMLCAAGAWLDQHETTQ